MRVARWVSNREIARALRRVSSRLKRQGEPGGVNPRILCRERRLTFKQIIIARHVSPTIECYSDSRRSDKFQAVRTHRRFDEPEPNCLRTVPASRPTTLQELREGIQVFRRRMLPRNRECTAAKRLSFRPPINRHQMRAKSERCIRRCDRFRALSVEGMHHVHARTKIAISESLTPIGGWSEKRYHPFPSQKLGKSVRSRFGGRTIRLVPEWNQIEASCPQRSQQAVTQPKSSCRSSSVKGLSNFHKSAPISYRFPSRSSYHQAPPMCTSTSTATSIAEKSIWSTEPILRAPAFELIQSTFRFFICNEHRLSICQLHRGFIVVVEAASVSAKAKISASNLRAQTFRNGINHRRGDSDRHYRDAECCRNRSNPYRIHFAPLNPFSIKTASRQPPLELGHDISAVEMYCEKITQLPIKQLQLGHVIGCARLQTKRHDGLAKSLLSVYDRENKSQFCLMGRRV